MHVDVVQLGRYLFVPRQIVGALLKKGIISSFASGNDASPLGVGGSSDGNRYKP